MIDELAKINRDVVNDAEKEDDPAMRQGAYASMMKVILGQLYMVHPDRRRQFVADSGFTEDWMIDRIIGRMK